MRIGIYAGTFDPITLGHIDIIKRSLAVVDKLIIAVALDTGKSSIFDINSRVELVQQSLVDYNNIEITKFSGLLVNFAAQHNAKLLIRGLRAVSDFEYEFQMACMNSKLAPNMETIFLTASESTHFVSSGFVRQIAKLGGDISGLVTSNVEEAVKNYFINK